MRVVKLAQVALEVLLKFGALNPKLKMFMGFFQDLIKP